MTNLDSPTAAPTHTTSRQELLQQLVSLPLLLPGLVTPHAPRLFQEHCLAIRLTLSKYLETVPAGVGEGGRRERECDSVQQQSYMCRVLILVTTPHYTMYKCTRPEHFA